VHIQLRHKKVVEGAIVLLALLVLALSVSFSWQSYSDYRTDTLAAKNSELAYLPVSDIRTPTPGGLHAVTLATGERVWYQPPPPLKCQAGPGCNAALISAPTLVPGVLFSASNDGALRAHATKDGSVIWEFDTNREFKTLNGVRANGGAIQGAGPAVADGMLYLNSGYGDHLGRPGNVLLAFEVQ